MAVVRINKVEQEAIKVKAGYSYYFVFKPEETKEAELVFTGGIVECISFMRNL